MFTIQPRALVFGTALPTGTTGALRPIMAPDRPYLTVHHTGAGAFTDLGDTATEMRNIQRVALATGKPWEYNYVIDSAGDVWTYAGEYQAAHCVGRINGRVVSHNPTAIGVLLLANTVTETVPDPMVNALRWFRGELVNRGRLAANHQMTPHRSMPGAATACPGPHAMARWPEMTAPWQPQPNPQPEGDDMTATLWRHSKYRNVFLIGSGSTVNVSPAVYASLRARGVPEVVDAHDQLLKTCMTQAGLTPADLVLA